MVYQVNAIRIYIEVLVSVSTSTKLTLNQYLATKYPLQACRNIMQWCKRVLRCYIINYIQQHYLYEDTLYYVFVNETTNDLVCDSIVKTFRINYEKSVENSSNFQRIQNNCPTVNYNSHCTSYGIKCQNILQSPTVYSTSHCTTRQFECYILGSIEE